MNKQSDSPAQFNDPLAQQTLWAPISAATSSFTTMRLIDIQGGMRYQVTRTALFFCLLFTMTGCAILYFAGPHISGNWQPQTWEGNIAPAIFGAVFTLAGMLLLRYMTQQRIIFDISSQMFTRGNQRVYLSDIHALQLLPCQNGDYANYQINVIKKDGTRIHVLNHSSIDTTRADAETLSLLLGCKVWDAI